MAELEQLNRQLSGNPGDRGSESIGQRRDTWKMNFKMKNNLEQKEEKEKLIQEVIVPKFRATIVQDIANPMIEDTKDLIKRIDEYDDQSRELATKLNDVSKQNKQFKDAMPQIDEQIALLKNQLATFDKLVVNADSVQEEIFKPKSEIDAKIVQQQCKIEAYQKLIFGFREPEEVTDLKDSLKNIRKVSSKQFKA